MKEKLTIGRDEDGLAFIVGRPFGPLVPHHHDELEVNLVISGQARYLFGAQCISLRTGSMIWLFPRQEHVLVDQSPDFSMWVLVFSPRLVKRRARKPNRAVLRQADPGEIFCRGVDSHRAIPLQAIYESAAIKDDLPFRNAALDYALMASWSAFQTSPATLREADVHPAVARAARLTAEADSPLTLVQLARQAGLSAPRLSRLFKLQTGNSLTAFRQRKCLERFLRLYGTGVRYTLLEAALLAGFGSYPQFHRVFCRLMKMNPAAFRRRLTAR